MAAVTFDPNTKQLSFVPQFFAGKPNRFISWHAAITAGAQIAVGTELAVIQWDDGVNEPVKSPIAGTIAKVNREITDDTLETAPAQMALVLE